MTRREFVQWWELFSAGQPWRDRYREAAWSLVNKDPTDNPLWLRLTLENPTAVLILKAWLVSVGNLAGDLTLRYQLRNDNDDVALRDAFRQSRQALANCCFYGSPYITIAIAQEYVRQSKTPLTQLSPLAQIVLRRNEQGSMDLTSALLLLATPALQREFGLAPPAELLTGEYLRMWKTISKKA